MTQQDKELLSVDLCARLPHNVIVHRTYIWAGELKEDDGPLEIDDLDIYLNNSVEKLNSQGCTLKPYLRPMSSMTEEEHIEYYSHIVLLNSIEKYDWLNKRHFDYRGLIEKGLALEAPKGMYECK